MKIKDRALQAITMAIVYIFSFPFMSSAGAASAATYQTNDLQKIRFVHYAKADAAAANKIGGYKIFGRLAGVPANIYLDTSELDGNDAYAKQAFADAGETWDTAVAQDIFGTVIPVDNVVAGDVRDNRNEIEFTLYPGDSNVIAVTYMWIDKRTKTIAEFDMIFNTYYEWGNAATSGNSVMDIQNIATHELGHAFGLGDIYSLAYSNVTMYGYSDYGDVEKRSLTISDITGIQKIYGQ
ncbi:MAG: matrixin family metalloprotease [Clostridiaceae bacterium]